MQGKLLNLAVTALFCLICTPALSPEPVHRPKLPKVTQKQIDCLVANAYNEAIGEDAAGRGQVSKVVFNRTGDGNFCKTIYQPGQFSWTETPKTVPKSLKKGLTEEVLSVYYGLMPVPFPEATSFHAHYVNPDWARKLVFLGRHGNHLFYRNHYGKLED